MASRSLSNIYRNSLLFSSSFSRSHHHHHHHHHHHLLFSSQTRSIFITSPLEGWMDKIKGTISDQKDKIKGVLTGQKISTDPPQVSSQNFTLPRFADELKTARKLGSFKKFIVGRSSEATFADAFEKQESIIRFLGLFDPTGDNLQSKHKQDAAKHCNCTITEVENALAKFTWAKEAQKKMEKLKEEGKPIPTNLAEVQKLMGSTPVDLARSNLAKSGQISRNALCPCGSKKRYKRCCGETDKQKA